MIIMSIDPGQTTGWCVLHYNEVLKKFIPHSGGAHAGFFEFIDVFQTNYMRYKPDIVVCESFVLAPYMGAQVAATDPHMSSSQLQGVIRYIVPNVILEPASLKTAVPDEALKELGLWKWPEADIGPDKRNYRHFHDACRHAVWQVWK